MHVVFDGQQRNLVPCDRVVSAIDPDDNVDVLAVYLGAAIEVTIRTELFDELDGGLKAFASLRDGQVLGTNPHRDALAGGAGESVAVNLDGCGAKLHPTLDYVGVKEVHGWRANEACNKGVRRRFVEVPWGSDLLEDTILQHCDAVTHGERFGLVVGHIDGGHTEPALQGGNLGTGLNAKLGVQVRQRFIHQEHLGLTHDGATHGDSLTLAA